MDSHLFIFKSLYLVSFFIAFLLVDFIDLLVLCKDEMSFRDG